MKTVKEKSGRWRSENYKHHRHTIHYWLSIIWVQILLRICRELWTQMSINNTFFDKSSSETWHLTHGKAVGAEPQSSRQESQSPWAPVLTPPPLGSPLACYWTGLNFSSHTDTGWLFHFSESEKEYGMLPFPISTNQSISHTSHSSEYTLRNTV